MQTWGFVSTLVLIYEMLVLTKEGSEFLKFYHNAIDNVILSVYNYFQAFELKALSSYLPTILESILSPIFKN